MSQAAHLDCRWTVIDDEWRALGSYLVAVDWDRNILYAHDAEEPEGVMAFSLETGEWLRTISTPGGDGPHEFSQGRTDIDIAPDGGLYISGSVRVVEYDPQGMPIDSWRPEVPLTRSVCNFGGAPAVPTQGGVVRRGPDGTNEAVGPVRARGRSIDAETMDDINTIFVRLRNAKIACSHDVAYVSMSYPEGPDSLFTYNRSGEVGRLVVPVEGARKCMQGEQRTSDGRLVQPERPCPHWSQGAQLSFDDLGNVVLLGLDTSIHGAIINPETGCYALVRTTTGNPHTPVSVHADSVLVFHRPFEITSRGGQTFIHVDDSANGVFLHPLRRVSGEPCPGMLPSVR